MSRSWPWSIEPQEICLLCDLVSSHPPQTFCACSTTALEYPGILWLRTFAVPSSCNAFPLGFHRTPCSLCSKGIHLSTHPLSMHLMLFRSPPCYSLPPDVIYVCCLYVASLHQPQSFMRIVFVVCSLLSSQCLVHNRGSINTCEWGNKSMN